MPLATAADLPPEIISKIVRCFAWEIHSIPPPERYKVRVSKTHLGTLSLACRYWARLCRPHMFQHLTLRNHEDLNQFIQFIHAPSVVQPSIRGCSEHITLLQSGAWPAPWFHRTHGALLGGNVTPCDVAKYFDILVVLEQASVAVSPDNAVHYAPHSFSVGLPRTVPGSMFPFYFLGLHDMRFRSIADVLRLIDNLPDLRLLKCTRLQFSDESFVLPPVPTRRRVKTCKLFRVSAAGGSSHEIDVRTVFTVIGRGTRLSQQSLRPHLMGLDAWDAMQTIVAALVVRETYERMHLEPVGNGESHPFCSLRFC